MDTIPNITGITPILELIINKKIPKLTREKDQIVL